MTPTAAKSFAPAGLALLLPLLALFSRPAVADSIPRPEGIQQDVNFWVRVYTEITTNEGFLHDERNLAVVYDTLKFTAGSSPRERERQVDDRRDRYIASLRRIIAALPTEGGRDELSDEDKRVLALWGPNV